MKFILSKTEINTLSTDALIIPAFKDDIGSWTDVKKSLRKFIETSTDGSSDFQGKEFEVMLLPALGQLNEIKRVFLLGLGDRQGYTWNTLRNAFGELVRLTGNYSVKRAAVLCRPALVNGQDWSRFTQTVVEGMELGSYRFDSYKSTPNQDGTRVSLVRIEFAGIPSEYGSSAKKGIDVGSKLSEAVVFARDLGNHPGNIATPTMLAKTARSMAKELGLQCTILTESEMKRLKMGALLGVAQGSQQPPRMIILEHKKGKARQAPVVLVGKGVTFDSGGISLKPGKSMDEMKFDMSGGGNVIGIMRAVASLRLPLNVIGVIPAVENLPSGSADKPGDILTSMSGTTIEVLNTDAEGRLILADALTYVKRFKPAAVIDMATLTGAVVIALGHSAAGLMGNDDELVEQIQMHTETSGERAWHLPLYEDYVDQLKSNVADLRNIGISGGGSSVAAAFLSQFAKEYKWAHLDIAGVAWTTKNLPISPMGSTGFGVRLLFEWLRELA